MIEVGQEIYLKRISDHNQQWSIRKVTVSKIGKKYFYIKEEKWKFDINTLEHVDDMYGGNRQGYISHLDILNEEERKNLVCNLNAYYFNEFTLKQLKQIMKFIEDLKNEKS